VYIFCPIFAFFDGFDGSLFSHLTDLMGCLTHLTNAYIVVVPKIEAMKYEPLKYEVIPGKMESKHPPEKSNKQGNKEGKD
jgi:hypothetical protein